MVGGRGGDGGGCRDRGGGGRHGGCSGCDNDIQFKETMDWKLAPRASPMSQNYKLFMRLAQLAPNTVYKPTVLVNALTAVHRRKRANFSAKDCTQQIWLE